MVQGKGSNLQHTRSASLGYEPSVLPFTLPCKLGAVLTFENLLKPTKIINKYMMKTIELKCDHCENDFIKSLKDYNRDIKRNKGGKFYCSRNCFNISNLTTIEVFCKNCKKPLHKREKDIKKTNNNFCSRSCAATYNNSIFVKRKSKQFNKQQCKRILSIIEKYGISKLSKKLKTSTTTLRKNLKEHFGNDFIIPKKENNSNNNVSIKYLKLTKLELFSTRKNWQSARSGLQRRSRNNYINSGKPNCCKICGYDTHIEVAHIKAVSEFDDNDTVAQMTDPDNLVALCPNHHWEFDNGIISKDELL